MRHIAIFIIASLFSLVAFATSHAQVQHFTDGVVGQFDNSVTDIGLEPATITAKFTHATSDRP